jgi:UDP-2,3-diacylglucosamine hydrolase
MQDTLFISDLHLDEEQPAITDGLLAFLGREAGRAHALYVLGDLFESWVGDDNESPLISRVCAAFHAFASGGRPLFFMHGNRDFLLGAAFAARCGGSLIAENTLVNLHGTRTLLMHGDSLCTDDTEYQKFRAMVRSPAWQQAGLTLPLAARQAMAAKMRSESKTRNANLASNIMDVNADAVVAALNEHHADVLLHGHTHRPAVHQVDLGYRQAQRFVLGDWHPEKAWCVRANTQGLHLESFTP